MKEAGRYLRLLGSFARFGLNREMAFRGNFLIKIVVEVLWMGILLVFYATVFQQTSVVAGWSPWEYFFFLGCYYSLEATMEVFFLGNCSEFSELIRTGDLDFYLLQPIDEQFLISCRNVEWSSLPSVFLGIGIMVVALAKIGWAFHVGQLLIFVFLWLSGVALAYSFMLLLTSMSVWMVRNQSLYELWWLVMSLMRYPRKIFSATWFEPFSVFFTFIVPVMLVVNVPAEAMVKVFDARLALYTIAATAIALWVSRKVFRAALSRYRSASS